MVKEGKKPQRCMWYANQGQLWGAPGPPGSVTPSEARWPSFGPACKDLNSKNWVRPVEQKPTQSNRLDNDPREDLWLHLTIRMDRKNLLSRQPAARSLRPGCEPTSSVPRTIQQRSDEGASWLLQAASTWKLYVSSHTKKKTIHQSGTGGFLFSAHLSTVSD